MLKYSVIAKDLIPRPPSTPPFREVGVYLISDAQKSMSELVALYSDTIRELLDEAKEKDAEIIAGKICLALNHGHKGIYLDDGEIQCGECKPNWDYKRASLLTAVKVATGELLYQIAALTTELADTKASLESFEGHHQATYDALYSMTAERDKYRDLHQELIMEVCNKYPNESRHETARRIIRDRETRQDNGIAQAAIGEVEG
jgi:hypothetical protein